MTKINFIIILFPLIVFFENTTEAKHAELTSKTDTLPTSQLVAFLQQMDVRSFYGKPVDSFLIAIPANFYNIKVYGGSNSQGALFRASHMTVDFTPDTLGPGVIIHVREYTHMNRFSPTATWDANLFRREKIYKIDVYKDQNTCINGWCME